MSIREADLSRRSHRLTGRHRTRPDGLDIQWTVTCGYGFQHTDRTRGLIYGSGGWGFVREVASEWHVSRGDEEALVTQPD